MPVVHSPAAKVTLRAPAGSVAFATVHVTVSDTMDAIKQESAAEPAEGLKTPAGFDFAEK